MSRWSLLKWNVLIESDWNLKKRELSPVSVYPCRINRIRLEFKGNGGTGDTQKTITVLIESDWNLKDIRKSI